MVLEDPRRRGDRARHTMEVDTTVTTSTSDSGTTTTTRHTTTTTSEEVEHLSDKKNGHRIKRRTSKKVIEEEEEEETCSTNEKEKIATLSEDEEEEGRWVVDDIDELADLFERREPLGRRRVRGICGRVTKGRTPEDFTLLSDEPNKRLSWVVGPDGLERLCGKSPREIMRAIGKDTPWLRRTLDEGYEFKLCLFPEVQAKQATWDGVFHLIREVFPEAWPKVEPHTSVLPKKTLEEVQEAFDEFDIYASFLEGREHHHYMTLERYLESSGTLGHTRAFLYHELGLTHLFYGDGFTRTEDGRVGLREYLVPNRPLSSFSKHRIVDLPLDIAELPPEDVIPDP